MVAVEAALEHARLVHVPALSDAQVVHDGLAVADPAVPKGTRAPGCEADTFIEGPLAGGDTELADSRKELGGHAGGCRVGGA